MRDLLSISDLTRAEVTTLLDGAARLKSEWHQAVAARRRAPAPLEGLTLAMIFEKPSLRTRCSFEAGMWQLGGYGVNLQAGEVGRLGERESISDVARNLSRWCQIVQARVFSHASVVELAKWCDVPVINGLSDFEHPTQILADYLTIREIRGGFDGLHLAWVGDGNNVAHSLMIMASILGHRMTLAIPEGYDPDPRAWALCEKANPAARQLVTIVRDPAAAVRDADVVYTDVWASMGQETEAARRREDFAAYQVNEALVALAPERAFVLHDMPAKRGLEITDGVLDGPRCRAFDQAENRLHTIKASLCWCLDAL
jgi:ornithine carbamoyltransferase